MASDRRRRHRVGRLVVAGLLADGWTADELRGLRLGDFELRHSRRAYLWQGNDIGHRVYESELWRGLDYLVKTHPSQGDDAAPLFAGLKIVVALVVFFAAYFVAASA